MSIEALDIRDFASRDPRGFLAEHADGAIIDEVQHVPELLTYLQSDIDARPDPGRFILTGSQQTDLPIAGRALRCSDAVASQSGRIAFLSECPC